MLVLKRSEGQRIFIGDGIVVTLIKTQGNSAKIGIEAPPDVQVMREEIADRAIIERGWESREQAAARAAEQAEREAVAAFIREAEERDAAEWQRWAEADLATA